MTRYAAHVYTDQARIAQMEAMLPQLSDEARVELTLDDGTRIAGVVCIRPTLQLFLDPEEKEGINGMVRIDDLNDPSKTHFLWLDRIRDIRQLGPDQGRAGEPRTSSDSPRP